MKAGDTRVKHLDKAHLKGQRRLVSYVRDNAKPKPIRSRDDAEAQIKEKLQAAATKVGLHKDAFLIKRKKPYSYKTQTVPRRASSKDKLKAVKKQLAAMGYGKEWDWKEAKYVSGVHARVEGLLCQSNECGTVFGQQVAQLKAGRGCSGFSKSASQRACRQILESDFGLSEQDGDFKEEAYDADFNKGKEPRQGRRGGAMPVDFYLPDIRNVTAEWQGEGEEPLDCVIQVEGEHHFTKQGRTQNENANTVNNLRGLQWCQRNVSYLVRLPVHERDWTPLQMRDCLKDLFTGEPSSPFAPYIWTPSDADWEGKYQKYHELHDK